MFIYSVTNSFLMFRLAKGSLHMITNLKKQNNSDHEKKFEQGYESLFLICCGLPFEIFFGGFHKFKEAFNTVKRAARTFTVVSSNRIL